MLPYERRTPLFVVKVSTMLSTIPTSPLSHKFFSPGYPLLLLAPSLFQVSKRKYHKDLKKMLLITLPTSYKRSNSKRIRLQVAVSTTHWRVKRRMYYAWSWWNDWIKKRLSLIRGKSPSGWSYVGNVEVSKCRDWTIGWEQWCTYWG